VQQTAAFAAELWKTSDEAARAQLAQNFETLFGVAP
jgi:hypothetical protein